VALASNGAEVGVSHRNLIDGVTTGYTGSEGFALIAWPNHFVITLPKFYVLRQIRLLLWDGESDRYYRYNVEVSVDGKTYTPLGDHSHGEWRSWQTLDTPPRVVKYIRLKGLFNSANSTFHCVELEAYCIPPTEPATPKYPSKKSAAKGLGAELK
jgi:F5/8 type C domain